LRSLGQHRGSIAEARRAATLPSRDEPELAFDVILLTGMTALLERETARGGVGSFGAAVDCECPGSTQAS
jgi:hypothetical protein